jgi:hypothetical protein
MTPRESRICPLAEGEVIYLSRLRLLFLLGICVGGTFVFGLCVLDAQAQVRVGRPMGPELIFGLVGVLIWICGAVQVCKPYLRGRRLVLGADRIQMLERDRVLLQVPYDNIAEAKVRHARRSEDMLMLRLHDASRADTRWHPPPSGRESLQKTTGFDLFIDTGFKDNPMTLKEKILDRCHHLQIAEVVYKQC